MREHILTQDRIIRTAFDAWGSSGFQNTSLRGISNQLGISKTALYRHFTNKEDLSASMEEWFSNRFILMNNEIFESDSSSDGNDLIERIIEKYFAFFSSQAGLYLYFIRLVMQKALSRQKEMRLLKENFLDLLAKSFPDRAARILGFSSEYMRFVFTTVIFWLFPFFITDKIEWLGIQRPKSGNKDAYLSKIASICRNGIVNGKAVNIRYDEIESKVEVRKEDLPPKDRIIKAIQKTVSEAGLKEASIDRIAGMLGMKKSSLYFYFENKDEMLSKAMSGEQEYLLDLFEKKTADFSDISETTYAYMVYMSSYLEKDPSILTMFNWLRFQNIKINVPPMKGSYIMKLFSFMTSKSARDTIADYVMEPIAAGSFLHMLTFQEMIESMSRKTDTGNYYERLRVLHGLFLNGFSVPDKRSNSAPRKGKRKLSKEDL
jgi:AcrR family transcriptional regulator